MYPGEQRIPERLSEASQARHQARQYRRRTDFLKGPIPIEWLCRAARLPGKALAVALALWFQAGTRKRSTDLVIGKTLLERFGLSRRSRGRGLDELEQLTRDLLRDVSRRDRIGAGARQFALEAYDIKKLLPKYLSIFENLMRK